MEYLEQGWMPVYIIPKRETVLDRRNNNVCLSHAFFIHYLETDGEQSTFSVEENMSWCHSHSVEAEQLSKQEDDVNGANRIRRNQFWPQNEVFFLPVCIFFFFSSAAATLSTSEEETMIWMQLKPSSPLTTTMMMHSSLLLLLAATSVPVGGLETVRNTQEETYTYETKWFKQRVRMCNSGI